MANTAVDVLSLTDIAALARVQRPVVSVWRSRSARSERPFPEPVDRDDGQELFAGADVATWLAATRRGNNPHVTEEVALFTALRREEAPVFDATTALLALKPAADIAFVGLSGHELLDLADDLDPHDRFAYRELEALEDDLPSIAARVDAMTEAAFTPAVAFEAVMSHRFRLGLRAEAVTALAPELLDFTGRLAAELHRSMAGPATVVDPSGGSDLLTALRHRLPEGVDEPVAVGANAGRLTWRRLVCQGWQVHEYGDHDGRPALDGRSLIVAQLPASAEPNLTDEQILTTIDDLALAMGPQDRAVVVGPAATLTDELRDPELESLRSGTLRTDRVRAVIRMPAGLRPTRPRQRLAVWVLGPTHPDVAIADRWLAVADVPKRLTGAAAEDLLSDIVAALGSYDEVHAHAFRFARLARTSSVLAGTGAIVRPESARPARRRTGTDDLALRAQQRLDELTTAPAPVPVRIEAQGTPARLITLGQLVDAGVAELRAGNRLAPADVGEGGNVRVLGPSDLQRHGGPVTRTMDRLLFAERYPAGRYTEPGDIVFCTAPSMAAVVDETGFSVVETPARVLRLDTFAEPRLVPHLVALTIRGETTPDWRGWTIPLVDSAHAEAVGAALRAVAAARAETTRRLAKLDELASTLAEGLISGSLITAADDGQ